MGLIMSGIAIELINTDVWKYFVRTLSWCDHHDRFMNIEITRSTEDTTMLKRSTARSWAIIVGIILFTSSMTVMAQKMQKQPLPPTIPFDFADEYYQVNGVMPDMIMARRTGTDGLSVFEQSIDPMIYSPVRVLVTVPAYNQAGDMLYWYPLGELKRAAFTHDGAGKMAQIAAQEFPMFIFPDTRYDGFTAFANHRHAPVLDLSKYWLGGREMDPLGLRQMYIVTFTDKAFTKEGLHMMQYLGNKNGWGTDDTPIIKSVDEIRFLERLGYVVVQATGASEYHGMVGDYAVAPVFTNPKGGAIYPDAFLWMSLKDGEPLKTEEMFMLNFDCLKKEGTWCAPMDH